MDTLLDVLRWVFLLSCVLPAIVMFVLSVVAFYFGRKWVEEFIDPDVEKLSDKLVKMRAKSPDIEHEKLIKTVVREQAFKCGLVGAVTGFGGFVTLPIALPVDLLLSARYHAAMVSFIAQVYGYEDAVENKIATYAVMTGSTEVSKLTSRLMLKYLPELIEKLSSKLIPFFGALIAFVVNYVIARSTGMLAMKWYRDRPRAEILRTGERPTATA